MCDKYRSSNIHPGGFSEKFRVPRWNVSRGGVFKVPEALDWELAALTEPLACCIRGIERIGAKSGDSVLVVGSGPVGMMHAVYLRGVGAKAVLTDISQARVDFAASMGFDAVRADSSEAEASIRRATNQRGADLAVVASGSPKAIVQGLKSVRKGGRVSLFGIPTKGVALEYPIADVYNAEVSLVPTYGATDAETPKAIQALADHPSDYRKLVSHRFTIAEFGDALKEAERGDTMKVLITP